MGNNNLRILFYNSAVYLPGEGGYKRTMYLFDMMRSMGYDVTLVTSDFNHYAKAKRDVDKFRSEYPDYSDIVILSAMPYTKNISIKRWVSGKLFKNTFIKWFKKNYNDYDLVYTNMPGAGTNIAMSKICKKNNIKMIVDVRDLQPEVFRVLLKQEWLYKIVTYIMKLKADKAYNTADELLAVSNEYLQRGLSANSHCRNPKAVYIGAVLDKFYNGIEKYASGIHKPEGEIWATYAGTLGTTYDLYTLIDVAKSLQNKGFKNIKFKILGQGPEAEPLKLYAKNNEVENVDFIGFVDYEMMAAYLSKSDMTINSLKARASQSIINKVADYFAAGIPILNGSLCKEMRDLVDNYSAGVNFVPENVESLENAILYIINNPEKSKEYGVNAKALALEKFDRKTSYLEIIKTIEEVAKY